MLDNDAAKLQIVEFYRKQYTSNVVGDFKSQVSKDGSWLLKFTITGVAAASLKTIAVKVEGQTLTYSTTAAQTATAAATAAAAAWNTALNTTFGTGTYTVSASTGVISIQKNSSAFIVFDGCYSTDTTQKIACTYGWVKDQYLLLNATVKFTGDPARIEDGYAMVANIPTGNRETKILTKLVFANEAAAAKSVRYLIKYFYPTVGWVADSAGITTISSTGAAGTELTTSNVLTSVIGATRYAVVLFDDGASGNLSSCNLSAIAVIQN